MKNGNGDEDGLFPVKQSFNIWEWDFNEGVIRVTNQSALRPNQLIPGICYRYTIYVFSSILGRIWRFFRTGWRPLALFFLVCLLLGLFIIQISNPAVAVPTAGTNLSDTNNTQLDSIAAAATGEIAPGGIQKSIMNITTGFIPEGVRSFATQMNGAGLAWTLAIFLFGYIAYYGYRSKQQVFVGKFDNYTGAADGSSPLGKFPEGVSTLLTGELHRLRALYAEVDDRRAIASVGERSGQLDYTIQAGDTGQMIKDAISVENKVKIGPIDIPIGAIAGVFSKILAGPQITGGFHRDGDLVILNAFMSGKDTRSWRVEGKIGAKAAAGVDTGVRDLPVSTDLASIRLVENGGKIENLDLMVKELACRIFTDLTPEGTTKWRATYYFTEGLKDYRSCLLSKKNQLRNLKNAERRFFEAISEDSTFILAWYNLGVVYTELGHLEAAEQAFLKAVEKSPGMWQPYYALALNRFNRINRICIKRGYRLGLFGIGNNLFNETPLRDILHSCEQAVKLNPHNPHLDILIGVCYRIFAINRRISGSDRDPSETSEICIKKASEHHRRAVNDAWHTFCYYQFWRSGIPETKIESSRKVCTTALWDLARTYFGDSMCPSWRTNILHSPITWVLDQGLIVDKNNAVLLQMLGSVYYHQKKYPEANRSFESATKIDPDNLTLWVLFALSSHQLKNVNQTNYAVGKILQYPSFLQKDFSRYWKDELQSVLCEKGEYKDLCRILDFQRVRGLPREYTPASDQEKNPDTLWLHARINYHIANRMEGDIRVKIEKYKTALDYLSDHLLDPEKARDWAAGIVSYALATSCNSPEYYRAAFMHFAVHYPLEIKRRRIDLINADLLLEGNNVRAALDVTAQAKFENPLGFNELNAWGRCLIKEKDYVQALFAFESALLLEPYDVNTLENIGYCYRCLGDFYQKREEKDNYWKKALRYYEDAKEVLKERATRPDQDDQDSFDYKQQYLSIHYALGCCYQDLSDYGNAISNFDLAREFCRSYSPNDTFYWNFWFYTLRMAEAYLSKRDHYASEYYFNEIFTLFENVKDTKSLSTSLTSETGVARTLFMPTGSKSVDYPLAGEIYIRALTGKAYSYSERDAGLDRASEHLMEADRIFKFMTDTLQHISDSNENSWTISRDKNFEDPLRKEFLDSRVPLLEAELHDRRGWLIFKKWEKDNLVKAKDEIQQALAIVQDADYYFHLAIICETLSRETAEKDKNVRLARAYCDHILDMAPRKNLEIAVRDFMKQLKGEESGSS